MSNIAFSFIFPVHNESAILVKQISKFLKLVIPILDHKFELVLVENGSTDSSKKVTKALNAKYSFIRCINLPLPSYGNAIKHGLISSRGEKIFILNVDYFDSNFIKKAIGLLEYVDIVIGSKTLSKSKDKRSSVRRLSTYFFNVFLRLVLNYPGTDTHGIKAFRRSKLLFESLEKCRTKNELFDTELVLRMTHNGALFVDLPQNVVEIRPSRYLGFRRLWSTLADLRLAIMSKYFGNNIFLAELTDADDYGISEKVNQAIISEVSRGIVQVVSIMPNLVSKTQTLKLKQKKYQIRYSMHFNLLRGKPSAPLAKVSSLVDINGNFYSAPFFLGRLLLGKIQISEVKTEFIAQYLALKRLGILPRYVNSEQHLHTLSPINQLVEDTINLTSMMKVRSIASTKNYLKHKPARLIIFTLLRFISNIRFGWFTEFGSPYQAKIVHPGTSYDR